MRLALIAFLVGLLVLLAIKRPHDMGGWLVELVLEALSWALFWW